MSDSDSHIQVEVEELVAACLARLPAEGKAVIEEVCAAHPEHAERIRKLLRTLDRIGLAEEFREAPARLGDYRLLERIGGGGMGEVWLAVQESLGRRVALKIMRPGLALFPRSRERFLREVEALTHLQHPAICPVFDAGEADGTPYLAMQYFEGRTLARILAEEREGTPGKGTGRKELERKLAWIEEIARGLHAAHEQGFVHRDVKPSNLMITGEGRAVLLDFGLARVLRGDKENLTLSGDHLGTPAYMAPEQISGEGVADRRSDVYSLGVTLFEALTLSLPFQGATREALYREILRGEASRLSWRRRGLPRDLEVVVATAMDPDPERRYQDALAFAEDLARFRAHQPIRARGLGPALRARRWIQRHPVATVFLAMLGLALGVSLWFQVRLDGLLAQARERAWVASARGKLPRDPVLAAFLAVNAIRSTTDPEIRFEAWTVLRQVSTQSHLDRVLPGHRGNIYGLDLSPDRRLLVTGSNDQALNLLDLESPDRPLLWSRRLSWALIGAYFCGPDHRRVLSAEGDGRLGLWDLEGNLLCVYDKAKESAAGFAHAVCSRNGTLLLAGFKRYAQLFSLAGDRFEPLGDPLPHEDYVGALALDLERSRFATGTGRRGFPDVTASRHRVRLWRLDQGLPVFDRELGVHGRALSGLEFSRDGRLLLAGSMEEAWLYDLRDPSRNARLPAGKGKVEARFLGPFAGRWRVVTASWTDGRVTLWDEGGIQLLSPGQFSTRINQLDVAPGGDWFSVACIDGAVRVFTASGDPVGTFWVGNSEIEYAFFVNQRTRMVAAASNGFLCTLRLPGPPELIRTGVDANLVAQASPDGRFLLASQSKGLASVFDREGRLVFSRPVWSGGRFGWLPARLSPDGRLVATVLFRLPDSKSTLTLWETATGEKVAEIDPGHSYLDPVFLAGTNELMVYCADETSGTREIFHWDHETGDRRTLASAVPNGALMAGSSLLGSYLVASPDGRRVLHRRPAGVLDRDPRTGAWVPRPEIRLEIYASAGAISVDGTIALALPSCAIRLFDEQGRPFGKDLLGHSAQIQWLSFSPDGRLVASASLDGSARLWSLDGTPLAELRTGEGAVYQANFSGDGRHLFTAHEGGALRRWLVHPEELLDQVQGWCEGVLSEAQRESAAAILRR